MEYPVRIIDTCVYSQLNKHTPIMKLSIIPEWIWLRLNPDMCRTLELCKLDEIGQTLVPVELTDVVERVAVCWVRVQSSALNLTAGQHVYRLGFTNPITSDAIDLHFSYIVQDDNPSKPYIYMQRDDEIEVNKDEIHI